MVDMPENQIKVNHSPVILFLFVEAVKELRMEKGKRQGYFKTQFLFSRSTTILWWKMFSGTHRNNRASQSEC